MKKLKITFILISLFLLSGCFQTTAFLGPSMTIATKGNVIQAGLQYGANTAFKSEHGEYPLEYIKNSVQEKKKQKNFRLELKNYLQNRIEATRKKLSLN